MAAYRVKFFELHDFETVVDLMELDEEKENVVFREELELRVCKATLNQMMFWLNSMPYIEFVIINPRVL